MIYSLIVLTAGFFVLVKGADWFVDGASSLASIFHVSQLVISSRVKRKFRNYHWECCWK